MVLSVMFFPHGACRPPGGRWRRPPASSAFRDGTLLIQNQILRRFVKKNMNFHQKIPVEKYFFEVKIFDHDFFKNLKISKFS